MFPRGRRVKQNMLRCISYWEHIFVSVLTIFSWVRPRFLIAVRWFLYFPNSWTAPVSCLLNLSCWFLTQFFNWNRSWASKDQSKSVTINNQSWAGACNWENIKNAVFVPAWYFVYFSTSSTAFYPPCNYCFTRNRFLMRLSWKQNRCVWRDVQFYQINHIIGFQSLYLVQVVSWPRTSTSSFAI